jgi:hypothetical protein
MTELTLSDQVSDQEFESVDLAGEVPEVICAECAASGLAHTSTGVIGVHCKHAATGGWCIDGQWTIPPRPVTPEHFWTQMVLAIVNLQLAYERSLNRTQH